MVVAQRHVLGIQYRCDPIICRAWKNQSFYPDSGTLVRTAEGVHMDAGERKFPPLVFLDTHDRLAGKTRVPGEGKHSNAAVARLAMEVLLELMALHPDWTVAVCCFYNDQVKNLLHSMAPESVQSRVTVDTVDGFQGKEYDAIVMGCGVWQQGGASGKANWEDFRRINVFLSRARMQVVSLASSSILMSSLYWCRALGASPWVHADVGPGSPGSPDLKSSLSCLRRGDNFIPCVSCCRGTDHALPPLCFSRSVLKKVQAKAPPQPQPQAQPQPQSHPKPQPQPQPEQATATATATTTATTTTQSAGKALQALCLLCNIIQEKQNDVNKRVR